MCRVTRLPRHVRRWPEVARSLTRRRGPVELARGLEPRRSIPAVVSPSALRYKYPPILSHPITLPPRRRRCRCTGRPRPANSQSGLNTVFAHTGSSWHPVHLSALCLGSLLRSEVHLQDRQWVISSSASLFTRTRAVWHLHCAKGIIWSTQCALAYSDTSSCKVQAQCNQWDINHRRMWQSWTETADICASSRCTTKV